MGRGVHLERGRRAGDPTTRLHHGAGQNNRRSTHRYPVKEPTVADNSKPEVATVAEAVSPITAELQDQINLQKREYGMYVAAVQIFAGVALAYNPGDAIPI